MKHVAKIRETFANGDRDAALVALDNLLAMGPQNTEALKLRAEVYAMAGRFQEELKVWEQVATIDREDQDVLLYLQRRQLEDREFYEFSEDLGEGGRRFHGYPRQFLRTCGYGLMGCLSFLILARLGVRFPLFKDPVVLLGAFFISVIVPWIGILWAYSKRLKFIDFTKAGGEFVLSFETVQWAWTDIKNFYVAQADSDQDRFGLSLILLPSGDQPAFEIDLTEHSTTLRARSYVIREITRKYREPIHLLRSQVPTHKHWRAF